MQSDLVDDETFGLYVHWPFCVSLCPYCNFNTHVLDQPDMAAWARAFRDQLHSYHRETGYRTCSSIFFGGGTPSLMDAGLVGDIIDEAADLWQLEGDSEITLEANPTSSDQQRFRDYSQAGINRLSIGVQSLRLTALRQLGRLHNVSEARAAYELADACFGNVSIDLMFGRQHQTLDDWIEELADACSWGAEHLSLYQLTIEPETAFGQRLQAGRLSGLPDDDLAADMLTETVRMCSGFGYRHYEISNFARPGFEGRHNLRYWTYGDFLGIGPGAHGRIIADGQRYATETELVPASWLSKVHESGTGETRRIRLSPTEQANEYLMMALRTSGGAEFDRLDRLGGRVPETSLLSELERNGLIKVKNNRVRATTRGILVLNRVTAELIE